MFKVQFILSIDEGIVELRILGLAQLTNYEFRISFLNFFRHLFHKVRVDLDVFCLIIDDFLYLKLRWQSIGMALSLILFWLVPDVFDIIFFIIINFEKTLIQRWIREYIADLLYLLSTKLRLMISLRSKLFLSFRYASNLPFYQALSHFY